MQNSVMLFTFFVFVQKNAFYASLVQNVKIISLSWNLVPKLIKICSKLKRVSKFKLEFVT